MNTRLTLTALGLRLNSLSKSIFLTNRIPLRGSKLRAASRKSWTHRHVRGASRREVASRRVGRKAKEGKEGRNA